MAFDLGDYTESQASKTVVSDNTASVSETYNHFSTGTFEEIKRWSLWFVDFADEHGLVNDYESGCGKTAPLVGIIIAASKMLQIQSEQMARQEMQVLTEESEFGMSVSSSLADQLAIINSSADAAASLASIYRGILSCRSMDHHITDEDGSNVPFTEEEKLRYKLMRQEQVEEVAADFDKWQERNKK